MPRLASSVRTAVLIVLAGCASVIAAHARDVSGVIERAASPATSGEAPRVLAQAPAGGAAQGVPPIPGQVTPPPAPRFDISRFDVQGNTLLTQRTVDRVIAPYVGTSKDFGDVQRALESLQIAYQRAGFGTVQVTLPEQELDKGVVVLRVIETRLGKVTVEGNKFFSTENVRRSVPGLREGQTPNSIDIGRQARVANENASKNTAVVLRAGTTENEVDAVIRVTDDKFWRASVGLDNTGNSSTGMYRLGFGYQFTNLFDRDHVLTMQYQMSPERLGQWQDFKVFGLGYRIPLYALGDSIDLIAGYSDVSNANIQNLFNFAGSGTVFAARYNRMLPRVAWIDDYEHRVSLGLDYRSFSNSAATIGPAPAAVGLAPGVILHPLSLTYNGTKRYANGEIGVFASVSHNIHPYGPGASESDFELVRTGARPTYTIWRYGAQYARSFANDVQMRVALGGQWTRDALMPGEKFGMGGTDSVRGMLEREVAQDRGYRGSIEVYSPDLGAGLAKLGAQGAKLRLLAFFDWANLKENRSEQLPFGCLNNACGQSASSVGIGLRLSTREGFNMRLDFGQMIDGGGTATRGHDRLHFSFGATF